MPWTTRERRRYRKRMSGGLSRMRLPRLNYRYAIGGNWPILASALVSIPRSARPIAAELPDVRSGSRPRRGSDRAGLSVCRDRHAARIRCRDDLDQAADGCEH